jgi:AcrR family transcriptional regulator
MAAKRRPGRPPRLSRETIVEATLALLAREPDEPLTIARVATEVGAVPAALYRHFTSLDDLLDGVLAAVLGGVDLQIRARAGWPEQVRDWMTSLRDHLLRFPAVLPLIGRRGRTSPAWLDAVASLVGVLEGAGLRGAKLARAHLWTLETTVGIVMQESSLAIPDQIAAARSSLTEMSKPGRARFEPLLAHLGRLDGDTFFAFVTDRTLDALRQMVDAG